VLIESKSSDPCCSCGRPWHLVKIPTQSGGEGGAVLAETRICIGPNQQPADCGCGCSIFPDRPFSRYFWSLIEVSVAILRCSSVISRSLFPLQSLRFVSDSIRRLALFDSGAKWSGGTEVRLRTLPSPRGHPLSPRAFLNRPWCQMIGRPRELPNSVQRSGICDWRRQLTQFSLQKVHQFGQTSESILRWDG
jgi:hypothetical protein